LLFEYSIKVGIVLWVFSDLNNETSTRNGVIITIVCISGLIKILLLITAYKKEAKISATQTINTGKDLKSFSNLLIVILIQNNNNTILSMKKFLPGDFFHLADKGAHVSGKRGFKREARRFRVFSGVIGNEKLRGVEAQP